MTTVPSSLRHRKQAWTHIWIQGHMSVDEREQLLSLLRDCAWAPSGGESSCNYLAAITTNSIDKRSS